MKILPYTPLSPIQKSALRHLLMQYFAGLDWKDPKDAIPPSYVPKILARIAEMLYQGDFWVYLARENRALCGFIIAQIDSEGKDWCKRPGWGFIRELYVLPGHRGKGIAKELVAYAKQWARERGCTELASDCEIENEGSRVFHNSIGFQEANTIVCFVMAL